MRKTLIAWKYFLPFVFLVLISCSDGIKTKRTINNNVTKTRTVVETISFGTGEGLTGNQPKFIKIKIKEYDSLNKLIYESYKERTFSGCLVETKIWKVVAKMTNGCSNEIELLNNNKIKVTYKNKFAYIDSSQNIPLSDLHKLSWLNQNE